MGCRQSEVALLLWAAMLLRLAAAASKPAVVAGPVSRVEDARLFHIYYGQAFKVIKNTWDGKSYLLMQSTSKMATKTRYCTGRIKSFVVPLANYSVDTAAASPVSFFELLGVLENLKGITSPQVASQCVLQAYATGNVQLVNKTDTGKLSQFRAHFVSTDEDKGCNFAAYVPSEEDTPLQRAEWIKYLGTFTNSEDRANAVYDAVKTSKRDLICIVMIEQENCVYALSSITAIKSNCNLTSKLGLPM